MFVGLLIFFQFFKVRHKLSGKLFALKQIPKSAILNDSRRLEQLKIERRILIELGNRDLLVMLHASFESEDSFNLLLEFHPGGELFYHLQRIRITETEARFYFCQILVILEYLHIQKVLYRDLKVFLIKTWNLNDFCKFQNDLFL